MEPKPFHPPVLSLFELPPPKPEKPEKPENPEKPLIDAIGIQLMKSYTDADGGHQAIDVMAEAIQSEPARAVGQAWGVTIAWNSVMAYTGN